VWRTASVAAATCVDANIASTAAIVRGHAAPRWLAEAGLPARLVSPEGVVVHVAGWPEPGR
jgi:thiamine biosynthesis lipoprotein